MWLGEHYGSNTPFTAGASPIPRPRCHRATCRPSLATLSCATETLTAEPICHTYKVKTRQKPPLVVHFQALLICSHLTFIHPSYSFLQLSCLHRKPQTVLSAVRSSLPSPLRLQTSDSSTCLLPTISPT